MQYYALTKIVSVYVRKSPTDTLTFYLFTAVLNLRTGCRDGISQALPLNSFHRLAVNGNLPQDKKHFFKR